MEDAGCKEEDEGPMISDAWRADAGCWEESNGRWTDGGRWVTERFTPIVHE